MSKELERYFGEIDLTQIIGDMLTFAFIYEVSGTNVSQTDYNINAKLRDRFGTVVTTLTTSKSTSAITDDTVTISAFPDELPSEEGVYYYDVERVFKTESRDVKTLLRGKIQFIKQTTY